MLQFSERYALWQMLRLGTDNSSLPRFLFLPLIPGKRLQNALQETSGRRCRRRIFSFSA